MGLIVTDLDGNRLDVTKATIRYVAKRIFGGILRTGYILIGFTEKKQGLHDMIAGTFVIRK
ncbi:MAG: RDD family protein [Methanoculleus sp.]|nr:RDD family protein [Methanoculleus sp.]